MDSDLENEPVSSTGTESNANMKDKEDIVRGFIKEKEIIAAAHKEEVEELKSRFEDEQRLLKQELEAEKERIMEEFREKHTEEKTKFQYEAAKTREAIGKELHSKETRLIQQHKEEMRKIKREYEKIVQDKRDEIRNLSRDVEMYQQKALQPSDSVVNINLELDNLERKHEKEVEIMKSNHEREVESLEEDFQFKLAEYERELKREEASFVTTLGKDAENLYIEFEAEKAKMKEDHQKELNLKVETVERLLCDQAEADKNRMIKRFEEEMTQVEEELKRETTEKLYEKHKTIICLEREKEDLIHTLHLERFSLARVYNREMSLLTKPDPISKEDLEVALIDEVAKVRHEYDTQIQSMEARQRKEVDAIRKSQRPLEEIEAKHKKDLKELARKYEQEKDELEARLRREQFHLLKSFEFEKQDSERMYGEMLENKQAEFLRKEEDLRGMYEKDIEELRTFAEERHRLSEELEKGREKNTDLEDLIEELKSKKAMSEDELEKANRKCQQLQVNMAELEKNLEELRLGNNEEAVANEENSNDLKQSEELRKFAEERRRLDEELEKEKERNTELENLVEELKSKKAILEDDLETECRKSQRLEMEIAELKTKLDCLPSKSTRPTHEQDTQDLEKILELEKYGLDDSTQKELLDRFKDYLEKSEEEETEKDMKEHAASEENLEACTATEVGSHPTDVDCANTALAEFQQISKEYQDIIDDLQRALGTKDDEIKLVKDNLETEKQEFAQRILTLQADLNNSVSKEDQDQDHGVEDLRASNKRLKDVVNEHIQQLGRLCAGNMSIADTGGEGRGPSDKPSAGSVSNARTYKGSDLLDETLTEGVVFDKEMKDKVNDCVKEIVRQVQREHELETLEIEEKHMQEKGNLLEELAQEKKADLKLSEEVLCYLQDQYGTIEKESLKEMLKEKDGETKKTTDQDQHKTDTKQEVSTKDVHEHASQSGDGAALEKLRQENEELKRSSDELQNTFEKEKEDLMEKLSTQHKEFVMNPEAAVIEGLLKEKSALEHICNVERFYLSRLYYCEMKDELEEILAERKNKSREDKLKIVLKFGKDISDLQRLIIQKEEHEVSLLEDKEDLMKQLLETQRNSPVDRELDQDEDERLKFETARLEAIIPLKEEIADLQNKRHMDHESSLTVLKEAYSLIKDLMETRSPRDDFDEHWSFHSDDSQSEKESIKGSSGERDRESPTIPIKESANEDRVGQDQKPQVESGKESVSWDTVGQDRNSPQQVESGEESVNRHTVGQERSSPQLVKSREESESRDTDGQDRKSPRQVESGEESESRDTDGQDRKSPREVESGEESESRNTDGQDRKSPRQVESGKKSLIRDTVEQDRKSPQQAFSGDEIRNQVDLRKALEDLIMRVLQDNEDALCNSEVTSGASSDIESDTSQTEAETEAEDELTDSGAELIEGETLTIKKANLDLVLNLERFNLGRMYNSEYRDSLNRATAKLARAKESLQSKGTTLEQGLLDGIGPLIDKTRFGKAQTVLPTRDEETQTTSDDERISQNETADLPADTQGTGTMAQEENVDHIRSEANVKSKSDETEETEVNKGKEDSDDRKAVGLREEDEDNTKEDGDVESKSDEPKEQDADKGMEENGVETHKTDKDDMKDADTVETEKEVLEERKDDEAKKGRNAERTSVGSQEAAGDAITMAEDVERRREESEEKEVDKEKDESRETNGVGNEGDEDLTRAKDTVESKKDEHKEREGNEGKELGTEKKSVGTQTDTVEYKSDEPKAEKEDSKTKEVSVQTDSIGLQEVEDSVKIEDTVDGEKDEPEEKEVKSEKGESAERNSVQPQKESEDNTKVDDTVESRKDEPEETEGDEEKEESAEEKGMGTQEEDEGNAKVNDSVESEHGKAEETEIDETKEENAKRESVEPEQTGDSTKVDDTKSEQEKSEEKEVDEVTEENAEEKRMGLKEEDEDVTKVDDTEPEVKEVDEDITNAKGEDDQSTSDEHKAESEQTQKLSDSEEAEEVKGKVMKTEGEERSSVGDKNRAEEVESRDESQSKENETEDTEMERKESGDEKCPAEESKEDEHTDGDVNKEEKGRAEQENTDSLSHQEKPEVTQDEDKSNDSEKEKESEIEQAPLKTADAGDKGSAELQLENSDALSGQEKLLEVQNEASEKLQEEIKEDKLTEKATGGETTQEKEERHEKDADADGLKCEKITPADEEKAKENKGKDLDEQLEKQDAHLQDVKDGDTVLAEREVAQEVENAKANETKMGKLSDEPETTSSETTAETDKEKAGEKRDEQSYEEELEISDSDKLRLEEDTQEEQNQKDKLKNEDDTELPDDLQEKEQETTATKGDSKEDEQDKMEEKEQPDDQSTTADGSVEETEKQDDQITKSDSDDEANNTLLESRNKETRGVEGQQAKAEEQLQPVEKEPQRKEEESVDDEHTAAQKTDNVSTVLDEEEAETKDKARDKQECKQTKPADDVQTTDTVQEKLKETEQESEEEKDKKNKDDPLQLEDSNSGAMHKYGEDGDEKVVMKAVLEEEKQDLEKSEKEANKSIDGGETKVINKGEEQGEDEGNEEEQEKGLPGQINSGRVTNEKSPVCPIAASETKVLAEEQPSERSEKGETTGSADDLIKILRTENNQLKDKFNILRNLVGKEFVREVPELCDDEKLSRVLDGLKAWDEDQLSRLYDEKERVADELTQVEKEIDNFRCSDENEAREVDEELNVKELEFLKELEAVEKILKQIEDRELIEHLFQEKEKVATRLDEINKELEEERQQSQDSNKEGSLVSLMAKEDSIKEKIREQQAELRHINRQQAEQQQSIAEKTNALEKSIEDHKYQLQALDEALSLTQGTKKQRRPIIKEASQQKRLPDDIAVLIKDKVETQRKADKLSKELQKATDDIARYKRMLKEQQTRLRPFKRKQSRLEEALNALQPSGDVNTEKEQGLSNLPDEQHATEERRLDDEERSQLELELHKLSAAIHNEVKKSRKCSSRRETSIKKQTAAVLSRRPEVMQEIQKIDEELALEETKLKENDFKDPGGLIRQMYEKNRLQRDLLDAEASLKSLDIEESQEARKQSEGYKLKSLIKNRRNLCAALANVDEDIQEEQANFSDALKFKRTGEVPKQAIHFNKLLNQKERLLAELKKNNDIMLSVVELEDPSTSDPVDVENAAERVVTLQFEIESAQERIDTETTRAVQALSELFDAKSRLTAQLESTGKEMSDEYVRIKDDNNNLSHDMHEALSSYEAEKNAETEELKETIKQRALLEKNTREVATLFKTAVNSGKDPEEFEDQLGTLIANKIILDEQINSSIESKGTERIKLLEETEEGLKRKRKKHSQKLVSVEDDIAALLETAKHRCDVDTLDKILRSKVELEADLRTIANVADLVEQKQGVVERLGGDNAKLNDALFGATQLIRRKEEDLGTTQRRLRDKEDLADALGPQNDATQERLEALDNEVAQAKKNVEEALETFTNEKETRAKEGQEMRDTVARHQSELERNQEELKSVEEQFQARKKEIHQGTATFSDLERLFVEKNIVTEYLDEIDLKLSQYGLDAEKPDTLQVDNDYNNLTSDEMEDLQNKRRTVEQSLKEIQDKRAQQELDLNDEEMEETFKSLIINKEELEKKRSELSDQILGSGPFAKLACDPDLGAHHDDDIGCYHEILDKIIAEDLTLISQIQKAQTVKEAAQRQRDIMEKKLEAVTSKVGEDLVLHLVPDTKSTKDPPRIRQDVLDRTLETDASISDVLNDVIQENQELRNLNDKLEADIEYIRGKLGENFANELLYPSIGDGERKFDDIVNEIERDKATVGELLYVKDEEMEVFEANLGEDLANALLRVDSDEGESKQTSNPLRAITLMKENNDDLQNVVAAYEKQLDLLNYENELIKTKLGKRLVDALMSQGVREKDELKHEKEAKKELIDGGHSKEMPTELNKNKQAVGSDNEDVEDANKDEEELHSLERKESEMKKEATETTENESSVEEQSCEKGNLQTAASEGRNEQTSYFVLHNEDTVGDLLEAQSKELEVLRTLKKLVGDELTAELLKPTMNIRNEDPNHAVVKEKSLGEGNRVDEQGADKAHGEETIDEDVHEGSATNKRHENEGDHTDLEENSKGLGSEAAGIALPTNEARQEKVFQRGYSQERTTTTLKAPKIVTEHDTLADVIAEYEKELDILKKNLGPYLSEFLLASVDKKHEEEEQIDRTSLDSAPQTEHEPFGTYEDTETTDLERSINENGTIHDLLEAQQKELKALRAFKDEIVESLPRGNLMLNEAQTNKVSPKDEVEQQPSDEDKCVPEQETAEENPVLMLRENLPKDKEEQQQQPEQEQEQVPQQKREQGQEQEQQQKLHQEEKQRQEQVPQQEHEQKPQQGQTQEQEQMPQQKQQQQQQIQERETEQPQQQQQQQEQERQLQEIVQLTGDQKPEKSGTETCKKDLDILKSKLGSTLTEALLVMDEENTKGRQATEQAKPTLEDLSDKLTSKKKRKKSFFSLPFKKKSEKVPLSKCKLQALAVMQNDKETLECVLGSYEKELEQLRKHCKGDRAEDNTADIVSDYKDKITVLQEVNKRLNEELEQSGKLETENEKLKKETEGLFEILGARLSSDIKHLNETNNRKNSDPGREEADAKDKFIFNAAIKIMQEGKTMGDVVESYEEDLGNLERENKALKDCIGSEGNESTSFLDAMADYENKIKELERNQKKLECKYGLLSERVGKDLARDLVESQHENIDETDKLHLKAVGIMSNEDKTLAQVVGNYEDELGKIKKELVALQSLLSDEDSGAGKTTSEPPAEYKDQLEKLKTEFSHLEGNLDTFTDRLGKDLESEDVKSSDNESEATEIVIGQSPAPDIMAELEKELERLTDENNALRKLLEDGNNEGQSVADLVSDYELKLRNMREKNESCERDLNALTKKVGKKLAKEMLKSKGENKELLLNAPEIARGEKKALYDVAGKCEDNTTTEKMAKDTRLDALELMHKEGRSLEDVLETYEDELRRLREEKKVFKQLLSEQDETDSEHEKEIERLRDENDALRKLLEDGNNEGQSVTDLVSDYELKLRNMRQNNQSVERDLNALTKKVGKELASEMLKPNGENIELLLNAPEIARGEKKVLCDVAEKCEDNTTAEKMAKDTRLEALKLMRNEGRSLEDVLETYEDELSRLREEKNVFKQLLSKQDETDSEHEKEIERLRDENDALRKLLEDGNNEGQSVADLVSDYELKIRNMLQKNESCERDLNALTKKVGKELANEMLKPNGENKEFLPNAPKIAAGESKAFHDAAEKSEDDTATEQTADTARLAKVTKLEVLELMQNKNRPLQDVLETYEKELRKLREENNVFKQILSKEDSACKVVTSQEDVAAETLQQTTLPREPNRESLVEDEDPRSDTEALEDLMTLSFNITREPLVYMMPDKEVPLQQSQQREIKEEAIQKSREPEMGFTYPALEDQFTELFGPYEESRVLTSLPSEGTSDNNTLQHPEEKGGGVTDRELRSKIEELEEKLQNETDLRQQYEQDVNDLLQDIMNLKMKQATGEDEEENEEKRKEIQETYNAERENKRLKNELQLEKKRRASVEESKRELLYELEDIMRQREQLEKNQMKKQESERIAEELIKLRKALAELQARNNELTKEVEGLKERLKETEEAFVTEKEHLIETKEREQAAMTKELLMAKGEVEVKLHEQLQLNSDLENQVKNLERNLEELKMCERGESQLAEEKKDVEEKNVYEKMKNETLKEQLDDTEEALKETIKSYREQIVTMETEKVKMEDELRHENELLRNKLELEKSFSEQQRNDLDEMLKRERERLKEEFDNEIEREKTRAQRDMEDAVDEHKIKEEKLKKKLEDLEEHFQKDKEEMASLFSEEKRKLQKTFDEEFREKMEKEKFQYDEKIIELEIRFEKQHEETKNSFEEEKSEIRAEIEKELYEKLIKRNEEMEKEFQEMLTKVLQEHADEIKVVENEIKRAEERHFQEMKKHFEETQKEKKGVVIAHQKEKNAYETTVQNLLKEIVKLKQQRKEMRRNHKTEQEKVEEMFEREKSEQQEIWEKSQKELVKKLQEEHSKNLEDERCKFEANIDELRQELKASEENRKYLEENLREASKKLESILYSSDSSPRTTEKDADETANNMKALRKNMEEEYEKRLKDEKKKHDENLQALRREVTSLQEKRRLIQEKVYNQEASSERHVVEKSIANYKKEVLSRLEEEYSQKLQREKRPLEDANTELRHENDELKQQRRELRAQLRKEQARFEEEIERERERLEDHFAKDKEQMKTKLENKLLKEQSKKSAANKVSRALSPIALDTSPRSLDDASRNLRLENLRLNAENEELEEAMKRLTARLETSQEEQQQMVFRDGRTQQSTAKAAKKVAFSEEVQSRSLVHPLMVDQQERMLQVLREKDVQIRKLMEGKRFYEEVFGDLCQEAGLFELDRDEVI